MKTYTIDDIKVGTTWLYYRDVFIGNYRKITNIKNQDYIECIDQFEIFRSTSSNLLINCAYLVRDFQVTIRIEEEMPTDLKSRIYSIE